MFEISFLALNLTDKAAAARQCFYLIEHFSKPEQPVIACLLFKLPNYFVEAKSEYLAELVFLYSSVKSSHNCYCYQF